MGCDEIRGAVAVGDGLCLVTEGPYEGYTVRAEASGGHRVGDIVAGPDGDTNTTYAGIDLTNCSSAAGGIVMPTSVSGEEIQSLVEAFPGRLALSNGEGTDAAGEACFYLSQATRERAFIDSLWDSSERIPSSYCMSLFRESATERCDSLVTTLCDGFGEAHLRASAPEACESLAGTVSASEAHGEVNSPIAEAVSIVAVVAPLFAIGTKLTEGVLTAFGPDLWAFMTASSRVASYLASSPRITTILSQFGVRAGAAAETAAIAGASLMTCVMGFFPREILNAPLGGDPLPTL